MPLLNRIRIANVSYDHKYIVDELYDTCGGVNTLLNLANGSGKSVLVQMMLQPILPCQRIHGRKIESYLTRGGAPTYLMLEWKLDRTARPAYFLTGIALGFSRPSESDDAAQIKYFTFTHQYMEGNPLDISHIPLVLHGQGERGSGVTYLPYEEARQFVRAQEQEHPEFWAFGKDKLKDYHKALREHGVFPEEWELLARINEKEGGVDELFSNCKTSDVLLDRWILSVVSDSLSAGRGELLEMFEALMTSILEEEKSLQDKEQIEMFLEQLEPVRARMEELCGSLDRKEQMEAQISGLYCYLEDLLARLREEHASLEAQTAQIKMEEHQIRGEELSQSYHAKQDDYALLCDQLENRRLILDERERAFLQAEHALKALHAAEYYEEMVEAAQRVTSLEEQIRVFQEGKEQEDRRNVVYTLAKRYDAEAADHATRKREADIRLQRNRSRLTELKAERQTLQRRAEELSAQQAALKERMAHFQAEEEAVFRQLELALNRNMLGELDSTELEGVKSRLEEQAAQLTREQTNCQQEIHAAQVRAQGLREERDQCLHSQLDLGAQLQQARQRVADWRQAEAELTARLERYRPVSDLYDMAEVLAFLQQLREAWQEEEDQQARRRDRLRSRLANFRRGSLHTDPSFYEALESAGIQAVTGEAYLKSGHTDERQQRELLHRNPLFPYCFLVARSDLKRAQEVAAQEPIERVCPIMAVEDSDISLAAEGRTVFPTESVRLVCRYDWESLGAGICEGYEERLSAELDQAEQQYTDLRKRLMALGRDMEQVNTFSYDRGDGPALEQEVKRLEREQAACSARMDSLAAEEERQKRLEQEKKQAAERCAEALRETTVRQGIFTRYLERNATFEADFQMARGLKREIGEHSRRQETLEAEYDETEADCRNAEYDRGEEGRLEQELFKKRGALTVSEGGVLLDLDIPALEERYRTLDGKISRDEQHLNQKKAGAVKVRDEAAAKLNKRYADIHKEDYENLRFSEEELERRSQERERRQRDYASEQQNVTREETEARIAKDRLKEVKEQLLEAGWAEPLPLREIKGNYSARRAACANRKRELEGRVTENEDNRQNYQLRQYSVQRMIDPKRHAPAEHPPEGGYDALDLSALGQTYGDLKERAGRESRTLERGIADLKRTFQGSAPTIDNVLNGIRLEDAAPTFKAYYFLFERLSDLLHKLEDYLEILRSTLQRVETQKENVVRQAASQGRSLYRELCKINSSANIRMSRDRAPQTTLQIGVPESLDGQYEERMRNYVSLCISKARESLSSGELTKEKMRRYLEDRFSDRQLLNTVIGRTDLQVKLYKVESISQNSRLKPWENIVVENSGGELFVSCFILISALTSYTRRRKLAQQNAAEGSKVFLIDNPFGKASSPHLLEAMLEVARKFDTQLICLSDLSQSSITQQFDLIYQLSMRRAACTNHSYLKTDEIKNNADLRVDGRLEHISAHWEQMSIL